MPTSSSRTKSSGPVLRSLSPSGRFCSYSTSTTHFSSPSSAFAFASSSGSSFSSSTFFKESQHHHHHPHHRSASPTRVNLYTSTPPSSAVRFSIDHRSISPNRSISNHVISKKNHPISFHKKTCMCSPTSHPGSFRCSLHKSTANNSGNHHADSYPSNRLNMRRSAMKNSLVRIGGVEGEWVKRALTALIRPSSHQQRRRAAFEPRPSRLSIMSKA
ncbi:serine-rich protein-like protein [Senna tora]|uniref:Serine-rich protein-like protein n=1 Tax=Senna tora TaxID=362788 RepID=A0A834TX45_9FABA|nr:serine-rich protein-like protein [Senna tora]